MGVLIKFKDGIISRLRFQHTSNELHSDSLQNIFKKYGVSSMACVFENRYDSKGLLKQDLFKDKIHILENWQRVLLPSFAEAKQFMDVLKKEREVEYIQLDQPFEFKPAAIPNDPAYSSNLQWHLNDPSNPAADIDAPEAWDINRGRNDVVIAILDGGVDYNHDDMDPGNRSRVIAGIDTGDGDNDPLDDLPYNDPKSFAGHGTSVAGIVGAITNNGQQTSGVMWECKIMPVKMVGNGSLAIRYPFGGTVVNFSATAFPGDVANAIDYAVNNGAQVINLSYGFHSVGFLIDDVILRIPLLYQTLDYAYLNNVVTCAAMGNEYETDNSPSYPAGFFEQVIPVGATTRSRERASFSNTGSHISVSAPGLGIYTTARGGGVNRSFSGTSAAAPIAAGVAGLIISQGKDRGFSLTNDDVKHIMQFTASDAAAAGFDNETGYGIINAKNALQLLSLPNVVYQGTATGGMDTNLGTLAKWIVLGNRWGLAAGIYFSVDQHRITKHVTFEVPFCAPPKVWMRERQSSSLDYSNPNSGKTNSLIGNVTTTGFDLEYVTYFVRYTATGAELNTWIPANPAVSTVAYTAVGQPNPAGLAGPIISPSSPICFGGQFSLANLQPGTTLSWSSSNTFGLTIDPATGYATRQNNYGGQVTVFANINGPCGIFQVASTVTVGSPAPTYISIDPSSCPEYYFDAEYVPTSTSYFWQWSKDPYGSIRTKTTPTSSSGKITLTEGSGNYRIAVKANNACGLSEFNVRTFNVICGGGPRFSVTASPNPATSILTIQHIPEVFMAAENGNSKMIDGVMLKDELGHIHAQCFDKKEIIKLSVSSVPAGAYYLFVQVEGKIEVQRVVIRK